MTFLAARTSCLSSRACQMACVWLLALGLLTLSNSVANADDAAAPIRVCLVSGSIEYKSNESLADFQTYLEGNHNIRCSRAFIVGKDISNLPGIENLDACDVMVLYTRRLEIEGPTLDKIKAYCQSGKPIVGIRTASHAFQNWLDLDKEVLGGNYKGHYNKKYATDVRLVEGQENHPVLAGVTPFSSRGSLYKNKGLADDCLVLMMGTSPQSTEPLTWIRHHNQGRIFYTSLGHPLDFQEPSFRRLLVNAIHWAAEQSPRSPAE